MGILKSFFSKAWHRSEEGQRKTRNLLVGIFAGWLVFIGLTALEPGHMNDFNSYYYGTKAAFEGLNPYKFESVAQMKGEAVEPHIHFSYPPYMLALFSPVLVASFDTARLAFLIIKLFAAFGLFVLWLRGFKLNRLSDPILLTLLAIGAYHGALQTDILAGNISVFEQLFLWSGLAFFFRNRPHLAMIGIVLAGLCKGPLILLLFILLIRPDDKHLHAFLYGGVLFLTVTIVTFLCMPELWMQFLEKPNVIDSMGFTNPSLLAWCIYEAAPFLNGALGWVIEPTRLYQILSAALAIMGLAAFGLFIRKSDEKLKVAFICLLFGLLLPRMKDYSFILQVMPALFIMASMKESRRWMVGVLICVTLWPYYHLFSQLGLAILAVIAAAKSTYHEPSSFHSLSNGVRRNSNS